jgi:hypothetical protein
VIEQIEREWQLVLGEEFTSNSRRWGTGVKLTALLVSNATWAKAAIG